MAGRLLAQESRAAKRGRMDEERQPIQIRPQSHAGFGEGLEDRPVRQDSLGQWPNNPARSLAGSRSQRVSHCPVGGREEAFGHMGIKDEGASEILLFMIAG